MWLARPVTVLNWVERSSEVCERLPWERGLDLHWFLSLIIVATMVSQH
jgi:hypothetical protein